MKIKTKTKKTKKDPFSLSLTCDEVIAEVEHHFMEDSILPEKDQIDHKVKISKRKNLMEFLIEDNRKSVRISCGGTVITVYKSDFVRELARYLARSVR